MAVAVYKAVNIKVHTHANTSERVMIRYYFINVVVISQQLQHMIKSTNDILLINTDGSHNTGSRPMTNGRRGL